MSSNQVNQITEDRVESQFRGSALRRLLTYVKPFWHYMAVSLLLVLLLTGLELYRPILVGDAIDDYISGYQYPYLELPSVDTEASTNASADTNTNSDSSIEASNTDTTSTNAAKGTFSYEGDSIRKLSAKESEALRADFAQAMESGNERVSQMLSSGRYSQMVLYGNHYYLFRHLDVAAQQLLQAWDETAFTLEESNGTLLITPAEDALPSGSGSWSDTGNASTILTGTLLNRTDLKQLRASDWTGIWHTAILYVFILVFNIVFNIIQTWLLQLTGQKVIYNIREELFTHIQCLSLRYFDLNPVGRLVTRATNDVEALNEMYSGILVRLFRNVVKIIGLAVVMLTMNVRLALFSFVLLPVVAVLTVVFRKISRATYRVARTRLTNLNTFLSENISGMKVIQIFAREKEKYQEFDGKNHKLFKAFYKEMMVFAIFRPLIYLLSIVALVIVIATGSWQVLQGVISIGTLYVFLQYINSFFEPIQELAEQFSTLQSSIASAEKIFTILDEEPMIQEAEHPLRPAAIKGQIEFQHVWFAYDNKEYVLRDVSFVIEPGQKVAFVGATGAGKSSILNLIGRYYDIQKGKILIDGIDIKQYSLEALRAAIGQVQQDVFLFTGDIKSNIRLKNDTITDGQVREAAEHVNAAHFIEKLPGGYDEPVTERGSTLSAGQRQLLSFARTLAYDPAILVMDEATANIDTETELLIEEALKTLMNGRTTIMVAHRLSTIQHADNIIVMHKGKIRESGTHQELLAQDGIYKKLYELQLK